MIKIGLLGAGRVIQNRYVDVFTNELKNALVTAVYDPARASAEKVAAKLGARILSGEDALFAADDVDAIIVATESGKHFQHSIKALNARKHVIVEKPPALFPDEILEVERLAEKKNLMYAIIFQNRLNPAMRILKKTFEEGRFGKKVLSTIRLRWCRYQEYYQDGWHGTWSLDGGVINQQAIHHLDALQWVCGPIEEVYAMQANILNQLEAEDTTVATVRFVDGSLGAIEATTAARPEDYEASISIVGEKGMAVINGIALNKVETWKFIEALPSDKDVPQKYSQEVPTGYGLSHGPLLQDIVDRLSAGRTDSPIKGCDTVNTVKLVHALYHSVENNRPVKLGSNPLSANLGKAK